MLLQCSDCSCEISGGDVAFLLRIMWVVNYGDWNFIYCYPLNVFHKLIVDSQIARIFMLLFYVYILQVFKDMNIWKHCLKIGMCES